MLEAALLYAEQGWPVLPLKNKRPVTPNGVKDATTSPTVIKSWWAKFPGNDIGLATGFKFDVIDIDSEEARVQLLHITDGWMPDRIARTPRGEHWYVQPTGRKSTVGVLPGVDFRTRGACVVAPPSTGYEWLKLGSFLPVVAAIADLAPEATYPAEISVTSYQLVRETSRYGLMALAGCLEQIEKSKKGNRNFVLNKEAFAVYQLVAGGEIPEHIAYQTLKSAALGTGLDLDEVVATLHSARKSGLCFPRSPKR